MEKFVDNTGVSTERPTLQSSIEDEVTIYGTSKPKSVWNLTTKGRYNFAGFAYSNVLYTNYLITGKSRPSVKVTNKDYSNGLTVEIYKSGSLLPVADYYVKPRTTLLFSPSLSASSNYYLKFSRPSSFEGHIQ